MATKNKKIITGTSKLAAAVEEVTMKPEEKEKSFNLVRVKKSTKLKTYRFYEDDIARLREVTEAMNLESHRLISETNTIRALIALGASTSGEKLLKALKETA